MMRHPMKTQLILTGTILTLGTSFLVPGMALGASEYLHFTRHRDSNGNLLVAPVQHQAQESVIQKTVVPAQPKSFERQSTDWGMSPQEVKDNETVQPAWELQSPVLEPYEHRISYHTQIEGIDTALTYTFYEDQLGNAKYVFENQHEDTALYVNDFHSVKGWITETYGPPTSYQEIWLDKLYQYDKTLWGQAVLRGHLVMVAEWATQGTQIHLVLDGGDDTIGLVADFSSTSIVVPVSLKPSDTEEDTLESIQSVEPMQETPSVMSEPSLDSNVVEEIPEGSPETQPVPVELMEIEQELQESYPVVESDEMELPEVESSKNTGETSQDSTSFNADDSMSIGLSYEEPATESPATESMDTEATVKPVSIPEVPEAGQDAMTGETELGAPSLTEATYQEESMMAPIDTETAVSPDSIPETPEAASLEIEGADTSVTDQVLDEEFNREYFSSEPILESSGDFHESEGASEIRKTSHSEESTFEVERGAIPSINEPKGDEDPGEPRL